jgi:hypothetical protein
VTHPKKGLDTRTLVLESLTEDSIEHYNPFRRVNKELPPLLPPYRYDTINRNAVSPETTSSSNPWMTEEAKTRRK